MKTLGSKGKRFAVEIRPQGWKFDNGDSSSVLDAGRLAGIILPSSCRNGTCRACMCRLVSGTIKYRIEWPGLLAEEKAENLILPCVAQPETDLVIDAPRAVKMDR